MDVALVLPPDLYDDPGPLPPGPECAALWTALWADGGATDAADTTGAGADRVGCLDGSNAAGRGLTTGAWVEPEPLATGAWVEPAPDAAALPAPSGERAAAGGGPGGSGGTNRFCFPASPSVEGVGCAGGLFGERSGGYPCGCFCGTGVGFLGLALPYGYATTPFAMTPSNPPPAMPPPPATTANSPDFLLAFSSSAATRAFSRATYSISIRRSAAASSRASR